MNITRITQTLKIYKLNRITYNKIALFAVRHFLAIMRKIGNSFKTKNTNTYFLRVLLFNENDRSNNISMFQARLFKISRSNQKF